MKNPLRRKRSLLDRVPTPGRNKSVMTRAKNRLNGSHVPIPGRNKSVMARAKRRLNGKRSPTVSPWVGIAAGAGAMGLAAASVKGVRAPFAKAGKFIVKASTRKAADKPKGALKDTASAAS